VEGVWLLFVGIGVAVGTEVEGVAAVSGGDDDGGCEDAKAAAVVVGEAVDGVKGAAAGSGERGLAVV
jgi:hypothetical protein